MSDDRNLDEIIGQLRELERELIDTVRRGGDRAKPVELGTEQGRLSRMDAMQQQQMALAERSLHQRRLRSVQAALERVDDGSFGECSRCGEDIALRRLQVVPEGPLCMACLRSLGG